MGKFFTMAVAGALTAFFLYIFIKLALGVMRVG